MGAAPVSRWRQRLAELRRDGTEPPAALLHTVQNVQNAQNHPPSPTYVHFEQSNNAQMPPDRPAAAPDRTPTAVSWGETQEERTAIVEHDGKIPRRWAEGFARLDPDRPPRDVPKHRWLRFIDDVGLFLDSPFCAVAAALGWGPLDLFGCDRDRPFARIDQAGLLWLLNGCKLIALSENTATVETLTDARQAYRRRPREPGCVLVWEMVSEH
jgi:hypothetical protein